MGQSPQLFLDPPMYDTVAALYSVVILSVTLADEIQTTNLWGRLSTETIHRSLTCQKQTQRTKKALPRTTTRFLLDL